MTLFERHNIHIVGNGSRTMLLAHGFGCDQLMWRFLVPAFQNDYSALKKAILHRKNALFYKTTNGARVGDLFMSLIHTC